MGVLGGPVDSGDGAVSIGDRRSRSTVFSRARRNLSSWLIIIGLLPLAIIVATPFVWMYLSSFKTPAEIVAREVTWFPSEFYWTNYTQVWELANLVRAYTNSILVSFVAVGIAVFTSGMCGFLFAKKKFWGKNVLFIFILSTLMVPYLAIFIPSFFLYARFLGLKDTYLSLILPHIFTPFGILITRQFLHSIPNELIDSATVDGAGDWKVFFYIILPLAKPVLAAIAILQFLNAFNEFLWPLVMIDNRDLFTLPLELRFINSAQYQHPGRILSGAAMALTPIVIFFLFFQRHIVKGISLTGLKG